MIVIGGRVAVLARQDMVGGVGEPVPDTLAATILIPAALDLI